MDAQRRECIAITPVEQTGFTGFGPSLVSRTARRATGHLQFERSLAAARQQIRQQVPVCPGVYGWLNADRTLTYIGKSKSLRHRLASYFAKQTTDPKMARIRRESHMIVWEPLSHELLALIREQELIDRWRPPYNVEGKPERRQPGFVCVSRGAAPTLFFARQVPKRAAQSFGPIAGRAKLGEVIATMNYVFQLRDCPDRTKMHFSNQLQLFENELHAQCL
ncbi:MAG: GIY-YIG nuclease family protein [Pirellulaceae bacterium]